MIDTIALSFGQQLDALSSYIGANWAWPSPDAGFALYVARSVGVELPPGLGDVSLSDTQMRRLDQAPVLAAAGYALARSPSSYTLAVEDAWAKGLTRLASRQAFTPDHNSFFYRPTELLGLSLGALHCGLVRPADMAWLRQVVVEGEHRLSSGDLWVQVLAAKAAAALSHPWQQITIRSIETVDVTGVALLAWLYEANDALVATFHPSTDRHTIDQELLVRCATSGLSPQDTAHAAVLYYGLRAVVRGAVATFGDRDRNMEAAATNTNASMGPQQPTDVMVREGQLVESVATNDDTTSSRNIFIVHGHNDTVKLEVARFVDRDLGLHSLILHELSDKGRTIIEKFEAHANEARAAIVLLTADDIGAVRTKPKDLKPRARQNVVLELGFFLAKLERGKVFVLKEEGVETPSDYSGVLYIPLDTNGGWKHRLRQEIKDAGIPVL